MEHPKITKIVGVITSWIVLASLASAAQQMRRSPPTPTRPPVSRSMARPVAHPYNPRVSGAPFRNVTNAAYNKNAALAKHTTLNNNTLSKNSMLNKNFASNKSLALNKNTTLNRNNTVNKNIVSNKNITSNKSIISNKNVAANKPGAFKHIDLPRKPNLNKPGKVFKPLDPGQHIAGSEKWRGPRYAAFRNYQPIYQTQIWWAHHYDTIVFIGGGWYAWDDGYWIPAWGYDSAAVYYCDCPIFAPVAEVDPCQIIANVQSALQAQGYYEGEIDGILNPDTQAALSAYQQAQGLDVTGSVDEPTVQSLGLVGES